MEAAALYVLVVGAVIVCAILSKAGLDRLGLPDLLGYLVIGVLLRELDAALGLLPETGGQVLTFLSDLGIIAILFRVGLRCNVTQLIERLPGATFIGLINVVASGGIGFAAAYYALDLSLVAGLFIAVALTTTSVGVSAHVWQRYRALGTREGEMMLDVAEIDDLTGVVLLTVLAAMVPHLQDLTALLSDLSHEAHVEGLVWTLARTFGTTLLKLGMVTMAGMLFAHYLERPLTQTLASIQPRTDTMLIVLGVGLVVAGTTALLGFPVAIGGFFAGLIFSRDPMAVKFDASFDSLYDLFVPFFFVGIGIAVDVDTLGPALVPALVLLIAAVVGKGLGSYVPARATMPAESAGLLAVSLLPRSEITLVVIERGLELGVVPQRAFTWMVLVVVATMVGIPLLLRVVLPDRWRNQGNPEAASSAPKEP